MNTIQERVIALIDMDCFYVQVEQRLAPEWKGKPCAVVQYNDWKGGGIIAVGYEARARGVSRRNMRGDDAKAVCPEVHLFRVPESRGKADLTRYREAGAEVITVLSEFSPHVERASVDEAYIDLTSAVDKMLKDDVKVTCEELKSTHVVGAEPTDDAREAVRLFISSINTYSPEDRQNMRLVYGASIVEKMRFAVREKTGFSCSAGISHNKVLSKLACGINKPNKQTILSIPNLGDLYASMPLAKVRHLGGKLGDSISENFHCNTMGDVANISEKDLRDEYGEKTGLFIYNLSRGIDTEPVKSRQLPQSVGCSKNFRGKLAINSYKNARHWIAQLSAELEERLIKDRNDNSRISRSMTLTVRFSDWQSVSRVCTLSKYSKPSIEKSAFEVLNKLVGNTEPFSPTITSLGLSSGKFSEISSQSLSSFMVPRSTMQKSSEVTNEPDLRVYDSKNDTDSASATSLPGSYGKRDTNGPTIKKRTLDSFMDKTTQKDRFLELESRESSAKPKKGEIRHFLNQNSGFDPFSQIKEKRLFDECEIPKHRKVKPATKHFFRSPILLDSGETTDDLQEADILQSELLN